MGDYIEEIANLQAAMKKQKQDADQALNDQKIKFDKQSVDLQEAKNEIERLKKELEEFKGNGSDSTSD